MRNWSISEVVAVCAIASPVLVTFINIIFKAHSEKVEHRLADLNASIKSKQGALNQISKAYSIFVIEGHTNDEKDLENFFAEIETSMAFIDPKDCKTLHDLELSVRQNNYLRHEEDFYTARNAILKSITSDKLKSYKLTTSKIYRFCSFIKRAVIRVWLWITSKDVRSKKHKECKAPKQ